MPGSSRALILAALLGAAALPSQQTIVVQGGGGAFAQAVAAAAHGDTLLVRPGTYVSTTVDKGVRVLCDPDVTFANGPLGPGFFVRGVPARRRRASSADRRGRDVRDRARTGGLRLEPGPSRANRSAT